MQPNRSCELTKQTEHNSLAVSARILGGRVSKAHLRSSVMPRNLPLASCFLRFIDTSRHLFEDVRHSWLENETNIIISREHPTML